MPRTLQVRRATAKEVRTLAAMLSESDHARQRRQADAVIMYTAGLSAQQIAAGLGVHVNTIYKDLQAFDRDGMAAITQQPRIGAPVRLSAKQRDEIRRIALIDPSEVGQPGGRWTLRSLREYLIKQRVVTAISREHLRQVLKRGGSSFDRSSVSSRASIHSAGRFSRV